MIDYLSLLFAFVLEYRVLLLFYSNPDALGVDELEKGIFSSLKSMTQLPPAHRGMMIDWVIMLLVRGESCG